MWSTVMPSSMGPNFASHATRCTRTMWLLPSELSHQPICGYPCEPMLYSLMWQPVDGSTVNLDVALSITRCGVRVAFMASPSLLVPDEWVSPRIVFPAPPGAPLFSHILCRIPLRDMA